MYSVYWHSFTGYKGKSLTQQYKAKHDYQGILYKVGYQFGDETYGRVKKNFEIEYGKRPTWFELWGTILNHGLITGFKTKEDAIKFENQILLELGPKDFNLHENISGIKEFRIANVDRKIILERYFNK